MKNKIELTFHKVIQSLQENPLVPLFRGGHYTFIEAKSTRINGVLFEKAIHYQVSGSNSKRVTYELIDAVFHHLHSSKILPTKAMMRTLFHHELCSRPCNYTVACSIAQRFIN